MLTRKISTIPALALTTALAVPAMSLAAANWQYTDWDSDGNMEMTSQEFSSGFSEGGTYNAWNRDTSDAGLSEGEFATGMFADWDRDNDTRISEDEYTAGSERWYGADYDTAYSDWDADQSGYIEKTEFGGGWDNDYFNAWDTDEDTFLSEDEFNTGVYDTVDSNDDQVITVEEEGWFEGWFDGDDVEAEVEEVGDVI